MITINDKIILNREDILEMTKEFDGINGVMGIIKYRLKGGFRGGFIESKKHDLPERYIINKDATILFWEDGEKTIVKRSKDDEYNKRLGFLTAYFQKHSGLSKNQANKYLANLEEEGD